MGIFTVSPAKVILQRATETFKHGDPREALKLLRQGFCADSDHRPLYSLAAECLNSLGRANDAERFQKAFDHFRNPEVFYALGVHFNHANHFDLAKPFLQRALRLDGGHVKSALELSVSLSARNQIAAAIQLLENEAFENHFWAGFQLQYLKLLNGQINEVEGFMEHARAQLLQQGHEHCSHQLSYLQLLQSMLDRYHAVGTPRKHIRDWHFVQYGSAILQYFDDGEDFDAGGRFLAHWAFPHTIRTTLELAKRWLQQQDFRIQLVVSPQGRDSEIIGRAMAGVLGIPFSHVGHSRPGSLVVVADNRDLDNLDCMDWAKANQLVFALNLHWEEAHRYTPDLCGWLSHQTHYFWDGGGLTFDAASQRMKETEPDLRTPTEIAADILTFTPEIGPEEQATLQFYHRLKPHLPNGTHHSNYRGHYTPISPVPGGKII